jgi:ribosomal protein L29
MELWFTNGFAGGSLRTMSVQELENQVRALPPEDLAQFSKWFEAHLAQVVAAVDLEDDWQDNVSEEYKAELLRRVEFAKAHPEALEAWEGTTDRIRQRLHALRAQKAATGRS